MSDPLVKRWLDAGELDLPLPGSGQTAKRWRKLAAFAEIDVVAGRLAEAHADATAILAELGAHPPRRGELWAVWAAESAEVTLTVDEVDGVAELNGTKSWCSGAGLCTHALVTAHRADGDRGLYAVDLRCPQVNPLEDSWRNAGMKDADTRTVQFAAPPQHPSAAPASTCSARASGTAPSAWRHAGWAERGVSPRSLYRAVGDEHSNAARDPARAGAPRRGRRGPGSRRRRADLGRMSGRRRNRLRQSGINRTARTRRGRNRRGRDHRQNRTGIGPCAARYWTPNTLAGSPI